MPVQSRILSDSEDSTSPPPPKRSRVDKLPAKKASSSAQASAAAAEVSDLKEYTNAARWIIRSISLFGDLPDIFRSRVLLHELEAERSDEHSEAEASSSEREASIAPVHRQSPEDKWVYNAVVDLVPGFRQKVRDGGTSNRFFELIDKMVQMGNETRSSDATRLKRAVHGYVPLDPLRSPLNPPLGQGRDKSDRGINHNELCLLLGPAKNAAEHRRNPILTKQQYQDGSLPITERDIPLFMYQDYEFDSDDIERGLCRGQLLLRVFRHIFTSPGSAVKGKITGAGKSKSGNGKKHGMTKVTGRMIAYAAVQARFAISSVENWDETDGNFSYPEFYYRVIRLFEYEPDYVWVTETLAWWNQQVFNNENGAPTAAPSTHEDGVDHEWRAIIARRAQRQMEKKARQAADAAACASHSDTQPPASSSSTDETSRAVVASTSTLVAQGSTSAIQQTVAQPVATSSAIRSQPLARSSSNLSALTADDEDTQPMAKKATKKAKKPTPAPAAKSRSLRNRK